MEFPLKLALRYLGSRKRASVSVGTAFATLGVILGVSALSIVMSVTGGFQEQFRDKVLGVNAHVLVLKYSVDFHEYREVMKDMEGMSVEYPCIPSPHALWPLLTKVCSNTVHVTGVAPFTINPMMITHGERTATGVLLKGVDPERMQQVLDLPKHIVPGGSLVGLRRADAKPPERHETIRPRLEFDEDAGAGIVLPEHADQTEHHRDVIPGGRRALLAQMERDIGDAGSPSLTLGTLDAGSPLGVATSETTHGLPAMNAGSIVPQGGYKSALPDVDILPDSIDPDPCKSPEQVAKLPGAVLGKTLAKQLGVDLGDCVQITSPTIGVMFGSQTRPPIAKQFRVIAMFDAGFDQYDSKLVYTDLYEAQVFYDQGDSVTGIEMKVDDIDHTHEVVEAIDGKLSNSVYHTMDWMDLNRGLFTALLIQQIGMSVVLALIIARQEEGDCHPQSRRHERFRRLESVSLPGRAHRHRGHDGRARARLRVLQRPPRLRVSARSEGLFHLAVARARPPDGVCHHRGRVHRDLPDCYSISRILRRELASCRRLACGVGGLIRRKRAHALDRRRQLVGCL